MNIYHFINDANPQRGGAQKILQSIVDLYGSEGFTNIVFDIPYFNRKYGIFSRGGFFYLFAFIRVFNTNFKNSKVFFHSRMFFFLVPVVKVKGGETIFVCHANYKRANFIFNFIRFDKCIAVSGVVKKLLENYYSNVSKIYNFVERIDKLISFSKGSLIHETSRDIRVCYVGSLQPWKAIDWLCNTLSDSDIANSTSITIVGSGPLKDEIQCLADKSKLSIVLLGKLNEPYEALMSIDIQVIPSYEEGFGIVMLEALCCGKKVVCRNIEIFKEITAGLDGVYYFEGEESLIESLYEANNDNLTVEQVENNAMKISERFGYKEFSKRYIQLFENKE